MSRIGKQPILIPKKVEVKIEGSRIKISGSLGELEWSVHPQVKISTGDDKIIVERRKESAFARSLHGLSRTLIANMVTGVSQGFKKELKIVGTGYKGKVEGDKLVLQVGYSHPVEFEVPEGIKIETPAPDQIVVSGIDKQLVGEVAARIRKIKPPEPYKGKGIRYADEKVRSKVGKAAIKTGFAAPG